MTVAVEPLPFVKRGAKAVCVPSLHGRCRHLAPLRRGLRIPAAHCVREVVLASASSPRSGATCAGLERRLHAGRAWSYTYIGLARDLRVRVVNLETSTTHLDEHHCYRSQSMCGGRRATCGPAFMARKSYIFAARVANLIDC